MSLTPDKKSDAGKSWMKSRRDRKRIIAPECHLIVTEGEKTEPLYFESLKAEINRNYPNRVSIRICGVGQGYNTLTLLEYAVKCVEQDGCYKHVWVVYDKDDFPDNHFTVHNFLPPEIFSKNFQKRLDKHENMCYDNIQKGGEKSEEAERKKASRYA